MKIRIAQLVDSLNLGGTERMAINIANELVENNIESYLLVTRDSGGLSSYVQDKVHLKIFNKRSKFDFNAFLNLLIYLRDINPHILHVHQTSIYWAICIIPFLPKTKLIWHDHFGQSEMIDKYPRTEMNFIFPFLDSVITVNYKIKEHWVKRFPKKTKVIYFLQNFPELKEFEYKNRSNGLIKIVNVANIRKQKDQVTLLNALSILKNKGYKFQVYLIGQIVDISWNQTIKFTISSLGLNELVNLVGPVNNIAPYLKTASMGVLSSESEGLPVALLEYGMASLPSIATNVGQCDAVLGYGEYGWLVPPKSPMDMANAIEEVILNPERASVLGENLKRHVKENFGPKNFMKDYIQIINGLINIKSIKKS